MPSTSELWRRILGKVGISTTLVSNGREPLASVTREPFDLILMDAQMPDMDAFETTAAIREREKRPLSHIPIVALTARAPKGDREKGLAMGMDSYLAKRIPTGELLDLVQALRPQRRALHDTQLHTDTGCTYPVGVE